jgi:PAS domain S-box-containing protein
MKIVSLVKKGISHIIPTTEKDALIAELVRKLESANRQLEVLSGAISDAIWDWDIQQDSILWSDGLTTIFGYTDKNILSNYNLWFGNIHPADKDEVLSGLKEALDQSNPVWKALYRFRCANGKYKHTYHRGDIIRHNGKPVRIIGTLQDIDERMTTLQEVEKLSVVASKTDNLVIITDANEKIEWVNEGFIKRTGYSFAEVMGKTPRIFQGPETDRAILDRMRKGINEGKPVTEEVLNYTKSGEKIWLKININPVFDNMHHLIRWVAMETDVTPHKEYENEITAIAKDLSDLIENANAIIFGIDADCLVNEWNVCAASAIGYSKDEVVGRRLTHFLIDPEQKETTERLCKEVLEGKSLSLQEFHIINRVGKKENLLLSATPRKNIKGEITGMIAVGQDITELTEYRSSLEFKVEERTRELKRALQKETEIVEMKSRFVSIASHEFRSPLSSIQFQANWIKNREPQMNRDDVQDRLDIISEHVARMKQVLDDVLTFSTNEAYKIQLDISTVVLLDFLNRIKEEVCQHNGKEPNCIQTDFINLPVAITVDENLLRSILINLLTNAIKFSPGKDQVYLTVKGLGSLLVVTVRDEGIGIPASEINEMFIPFSRGKAAIAIKGTGLGLSIVKKSVELLSGTIETTSEVGKGTTFTLTVPCISNA